MDTAALNPEVRDPPIGCPSGLSVAAPTTSSIDPSAFVRPEDDGSDALELLVQGARCAGCIRKIEGAMLALPGVRHARLNLSTGRLRVTWLRGRTEPREITAALASAGYAATAFDPAEGQKQIDEEGRRLLRALAVAAFASMNVMMFSVPIWTGDQDMGASTRTMMHWWSALIAVPSALYSAQPFFGSAFAALRRGRTNMDVPISLAVVLTLGMSLFETATGRHHAYFDSVCMLLFLLLVGRYLDHRLREKARTAARDLLAMQATTAVRISEDGIATAVAVKSLCRGETIALAAGDRVPVDSVILEGTSEFDCALLTGETRPVSARMGDTVHAGAVNLTRPLRLRVLAPVESSLVAQLARLIEVGEQGRARFVRIADKAVALYVPVVHTLAAATLLLWTFGPQVLRSFGVSSMADIGLHGAMMNAIAVLIITCPCALGLAVPAVQVVATGRLFNRGVLVKSGDALERLAQVDTVVLDKTGTLTLGKPRLVTRLDPATLAAAAALARCSRHPLSRALVDAAGPGKAAQSSQELAGEGVTGRIGDVPARLGRRAFAAPDMPESEDDAAELWFAYGDAIPVRISFVDELRTDAKAVVAALRQRGLAVEVLSGDRNVAVSDAARAAGVATWRSDTRPAEKVAHLEALRAAGHKVFMVGDGLNDAAALAAAHASASPGTAVEVSQAASDIVFTGAQLAPLVDAIDTARAAQRRIVENLAFSALYNAIAVPIAALGFVTPLIAALAMAGSSLMVTLNALRLQGMRTWTS